jgi:hypothetical protein
MMCLFYPPLGHGWRDFKPRVDSGRWDVLGSRLQATDRLATRESGSPPGSAPAPRLMTVERSFGSAFLIQPFVAR